MNKMNKLKRKAVYEAPLTEFFQVELEGVFCGSVELKEENRPGPSIEEHTINNDFVVDFSRNSWENN